MTGREKRTSLAVAERKRQTVQTARRLAECSRKWRLRQETNDGRLLTGMCSCSVNALSSLGINVASDCAST